MHLEVRSADGTLVGLFGDRATALGIAAEVLADGSPHVLVQMFSEDGQLVGEQIVARNTQERPSS